MHGKFKWQYFQWLELDQIERFTGSIDNMYGKFRKNQQTRPASKTTLVRVQC